MNPMRLISQIALLALSPLLASTAFAGGVCGPNFESYVVTEGGWRANPIVRGIRCVSYQTNTVSVDAGRPLELGESAPTLVWYGEGQWPGQGVYRHLGYAHGASAVMADFADYSIVVPKFRDQYSNGLMLLRTNFGFNLRGADINENWYRSDDYYGYMPSGLANGCGRNFQEYRVSDYGAGVNSLRCLLRSRDGTVVWYGEGDWSGRAYKHIGFFGADQFNAGYGMFDLCTPGTAFCADGAQRTFGRVELDYEACGYDPRSSSCVTLTVPGDLREHWVTANWVRHPYNPVPIRRPRPRPGRPVRPGVVSPNAAVYVSPAYGAGSVTVQPAAPYNGGRVIYR